MSQMDELLERRQVVPLAWTAALVSLLAGACGSVATGAATDDGGLARGGLGGGGGAAVGRGDGALPVVVRPPCLAVPSEAVFLGDSYITGFLSPPLQPALAALDPLAAGFRNHAVAGTAMASGGFGTIPPQFDKTVTEDPRVKLVIMTGGGNDFLICDPFRYPWCNTLCGAPGATTQKVCTDILAGALAAMGQLAARMANAGVKDLVYFYYPHIPSRGGGFREIIDYARPLVRRQCENTSVMTGGRLACHFIDLTGPFQAAGGDQNPANFSPIDGIHPSAAGQGIIASEIWQTMHSDCLGQTASSGCCAP